MPVYADESSSSATVVEPTPTPTTTPEPTPSTTPEPEVTPQVTPEITPEITPEATITPTPTPTTTPEPTPSTTPEPEVTPQVTPEVTPTSSLESTPTPTQAPQQTQNNSPPAEQNNTSSSTSENTTTPEPTPTPTSADQPLPSSITTITSLEQNTTPEPTLSTDKSDYFPTDTVYVTGKNFLANTQYTLVISSLDNPIFIYKPQVTTDENGNIAFSFMLDGHYRPNYTIDAVDASGTVIASMSFTDAPLSGCQNDSAGVNDVPNQKDLSKMCADYSTLPTSVGVSWNWDDAKFSGANTGDACALFDTNGNGLANYAVCVQVGGNPGAYTSKATYSCNDTSATHCLGAVGFAPSTNTTCSANVQSIDPFPTGDDNPKDTVASCNVRLSDVGGSTAILTDVCTYTSASLTSNASDCIMFKANSGKLQVVKVVSPSNDPGKFNLQIDGTTLATEVGDGGDSGQQVVTVANHTIGETAGTDTSLANYSSSVVCKDVHGTGSVVNTTGTNPWTLAVADGKDILCTITNTRINNASITIVKDAVPNDAQDFSFTTTGTGLTSFSLDDDSDSTLSNTKTFSNLAPGTYSVTESAISGWAQTSATCSDGSPMSAISLQSGESVTCTVTNTKDTTLTVIKHVVNDNGGTAVASNFQLNVTGTNVSNSSFSGDENGTTITLDPGIYSVDESAYTGYTKSLGADCSGTIAVGESKTCTVTNDDQPASLTVIKDVLNPDSGAVVDTHTFTVNVGANSSTFAEQSNAVFSPINAGTYTVTEDADTNYDFVSVSEDSDTNTPGYQVNLLPGEQKIITVTNKQKKATIEVIKDVLDPDGNDTEDNHSFLANVDGGTNKTFSEQVVASFSVNPGAHTVNEVEDTDYTFVSCLPGELNLTSNQTIRVTCTNKQKKALITVVKDVVKADLNPVADTHTFYVTLNGTLKSFSEGANATFLVNPGQYSAVESADANYSEISNTSPATVASNGSATITITNKQNAASISGYKYDADGQTAIANWTIKLVNCASDFTNCLVDQAVTTTTDSNGFYSFSGLVTGYYQVFEVMQDGWTNITSLYHNLTATPGATLTNNNFTNFKLAKIIVHKNVLGANGVSDPIDNTGFTVKLDGNNAQAINESTTVTYENLTPGTYTVTENDPSPTHSLVSITNNGSVTVTSGGEHHVYIVNKQNSANLTVIKQVVNDNGGNATSSAFTINVTGTNLSDNSFPGDVNGTTITLDAGSYSVDEANYPGYAKTLSKDCSGTIAFGESKTCTITNDDETATLIVVKELDKQYGGDLTCEDFSFTVNNGQSIPFESDCENSLTVDAGTYSVVENEVAGYTPSYNNCSRVNISNGGTATCTITNTDQPATLIVKKVVINDNGGTKVANDFSFQVNNSGTNVDFIGTGSNGEVTLTLNQGTYSVTENADSQYSTSYDNCTELNISNGGTATCTITNDDIAPKLTLLKTVTNDNGGQLETKDFPVYINQDSAVWGENTVNAGSYTVSETTQTGYAPSSWGQDCAANGSITLLPGQSKTCTITNDDIAPKLTVTKVVVNKDGSDAQVSDFNLFVNSEKVTSGVENTFDAGEYTVYEENLTGFTSSITGDCDENGLVDLNPGDVKSCTITNERDTGSVKVTKYNDENGNGQMDEGEEVLSGWEINLDDKSSTTGKDGTVLFEDVKTGTSTLSETMQDGWTQTNISCNQVEVPETPKKGVCHYNAGRDVWNALNIDIDNAGHIGNHEWDYEYAGPYALGGQNHKDADDWCAENNPYQEEDLISKLISKVVSVAYAVEEYLDNDNELELDVVANTQTECFIGNQYVEPVLEIIKSNNATTTLSAGNTVEYKITLNVKENKANGVTVTDLPPEGFAYKTGSWKVYKNGVDITGTISEPVYHSPGVWNLGNAEKDDIFELVYLADIDNNQDSGTYNDLVWAKAKSALDNTTTYLASVPSGDPSYVSDIFAGTEVTIDKSNENTASINVEKKVEGQVLGISTLPATGANQYWLMLAALLIGTSSVSIYYGIKRNHE